MLCEGITVRMVTTEMIRSYSELIRIDDFYERFEYLKLNGKVGEDTFGFDRYLNQLLYNSTRWRRLRDEIIARDNGLDLGFCGRDIYDRLIVHHMNPITAEDIKQEKEHVFDPRFLITTSPATHRAIHYGDISLIRKPIIERRKNDTCPWK